MAGVPTLPTPVEGDVVDLQDRFEDDAVDNFIRDFNRYVLGSRPERAGHGEADASWTFSERAGGPGDRGTQRGLGTITLTEEQQTRANEAFRSTSGARNVQAGPLHNFESGFTEDTTQDFLQMVQQARWRANNESGTRKDNAIVFLEILESLSASVPGGALTTEFPASLAGGRIAAGAYENAAGAATIVRNSYGDATEVERALGTVQEEIIEELQEDVESRTQEQEDAVNAVLARQQGILSVLMLRILKSGLVDLFYDTIYQIDAPDASDFVSRFTNTELLKNWFESPSSLLSSLIPKVRIFKEFTVGDDFDERAGEVIEFKFDNFVRAQDVEKVATGVGRGGGAGIQSFSWDFEGQNAFEITRNIKANLKIFVQDLSKLFPTDVLNISNTQVSKKPGTPQEAYIFELFRHVRQIGDDLTEPANAEEINPYEYRLKVEVGWFFDQTTLDNLGLDANAQRLMNQISRILDLTLEQHQINFNQDGTISIDLTYRSFMDGLLRDPTYYNILSMGSQSSSPPSGIDIVRELSGNESAPAAAGEALLCGNRMRNGIFEDIRDAGDGNVSFAGLNQEEFARALAGDINNPSNIINNYNAIFNRLIGGSRIYVLGFDYGLIASKVSSGVESSAQRAVDEQIDNDNADINREEIFIGSESTEDAFLRVVTNELTLEVLQNADFRVGRLGPEGVQVLQARIHEQSDVLRGILLEQAQVEDDDEATVINLGNIAFEPLSVLQAGSLREEGEGFNSAPEQAGENFRVYFTTLGDIVDVIQAHFIETAQQDGRDPIQDIAKIITGPYNFQDVYRNEVSINLSNILVDIDSFRKFFTEKVIRSLRVNYNFDDFMKDLFATFGYETNARELIDGNNLLNPKSEINLVKFTKEALSHPIEGSDGVVYTDEMESRLGHFRNAALSREDHESLIAIPREEERSPLEEVFRWARQITYSDNPEDQDRLFKIPKVYDVEAFFELSQAGVEEFRASALSPDGNPPKVVNYSFFSANYFNQKIPEGAYAGGTYDYVKHKELDAERGVFHLNFGERNSIIKNISFEKFDDQPLRTARVFGENSAIENLNFLREIYDVRVQLVGCPFIRPAQFFYLNPLFVGNNSNGDTAKDISKFLGIGGYFVALNVTNTIGSDLDYTTNVRLKWVDFGERTDDLTLCPVVPPSLIRPSDDPLQEIVEISQEESVNETREELENDLEEALSDLDATSGAGSTFEYSPISPRITADGSLNYEDGEEINIWYKKDPAAGPPDSSGSYVDTWHIDTGWGAHVNFTLTQQENGAYDVVAFFASRTASRYFDTATMPLHVFLENNSAETFGRFSQAYNDLVALEEASSALAEFNEGNPE